MRDKSGISLRQILERARNRTEKTLVSQYPRFHAVAVISDDNSEHLILEFHGNRRVWIQNSGAHSMAGYIPREIVSHANEIRSGENPAGQYLTMHNIAPTTPNKMLNTLTTLWKPWVLKELDLWEEAKA